jgi:Cdc6-like AAA superfamily ATPase
MNDGWYFPRTDCAKQLFQRLSHKPHRNIMLSSARRMGKTLFLLKDFMATAKTSGYLVLYVNLWQNPNAPQLEFKQALMLNIEACQQRLDQNRICNAYLKQTYIDNDLIGKSEIILADKPTAIDTPSLLELEHLLTQLQSLSKQPIVWILDEIQHLASATEF